MRSQEEPIGDRQAGAKPGLSPALTAIIYILMAGAYILFSDEILLRLVKEPQTFTRIEQLKGFAFVLITGLILYALVKNHIRAISRYLTDLRWKEEEIQNIYTSSPIAIVTVDKNGRFQHANPAVEALTGYSWDRLSGMRFRDLVHPGDRLENEKIRDGLLNGRKKTVMVRDMRLVKNNGEIRQVTVRCSTMRTRKDRSTLLIIQIVDETQRLSAEQEARDLREQLAHIERLHIMNEMAAGIAHEIIQPLTAITNYSRACLRMRNTAEQDNPEISEMLEEIEQEALRAGTIVQRLRSLVTRHESNLARCNINNLVDNIEHLVVSDARTRKLSVRFDLMERLPDIMADGIQLQQVILNLIRNAFDAMEKVENRNEGVIVRTSASSAAEIKVSITDHGKGLSETDEQKLFEPFFSTKKKGMGMGLSISKSIIRAHGGRIWFTRNEDRGITFHIALPTAVGESDEQ